MKTKKFLTDKEIEFVVDTIKEKMGPVFSELIERSGSARRWKDLLRFMPVSERCRKIREEALGRQSDLLGSVVKQHFKAREKPNVAQ